MSASDIDAGTRWNRRVDSELSESRFGIICVSRTNQAAPWILFEAGALAKTIEDTFVCPFLIGLEPADLAAGPLTQFQAKRANRYETLELVRTINKAKKDGVMSDEKVSRAFDKWWPELERKLSTLPVAEEVLAKRSPDVMIADILETVRDVRRLVQQSRVRDAQDAYYQHLMRTAGQKNPFVEALSDLIVPVDPEFLRPSLEESEDKDRDKQTERTGDNTSK
jgi:hypothetical protein